ncbi:MAG: transglycosylase SLT domain-containing protein [Blastocatellia bacterium]
MSQDRGDFNARVNTWLAEHNYGAVIEELEKFRVDQPDQFEENNYDYLLARVFEFSGNHASAMRGYHAVAKRDSVLRPYALWHLSQISRASGNLMLERIYLTELRFSYPDSLMVRAVKIRYAQSLYESGNYQSAANAFSGNLEDDGGSRSSKTANEETITRENLVYLAKSCLHGGELEKARQTFERILNETVDPDQPDDLALEAARGLDLLDTGSESYGKSAPRVSDTEHFRRAEIYQFNRDFHAARLHYVAIINEHQTGEQVPKAMFQIGRGHVQLREFAEAAKWFERLQELYPDHDFARDALLHGASAYSRIGKFREAIARYQKYIERYPNDERIDRAYLNIIDILRDQGEETEALQRAAAAQGVFRGKVGEAQALFAEARIFLARTDWPSALSSLEKFQRLPNLGGATVPGGTNIAEIAFLRGYVFEQLRRFSEAIDAYLSIPDGRGEYYGWRASERLQMLNGNDAARPYIDAKRTALSEIGKYAAGESAGRIIQSQLRLTSEPAARASLLEALRKAHAESKPYGELPKFDQSGQRRKTKRSNAQNDIADKLIYLGLYDEAAPEIEAGRVGNIDYSLARYYTLGNKAYRGAEFVESSWKAPGDFHIELIPNEVAELLYPAPYKDFLLKFAKTRAVDPRFILAIMRQESRFRPDAKSNAAARGLMQFILTTSETVGGKLGRNNFRQDDMYDSATAILFGSEYVSDLFKFFPDQPAAVAASYNGGEDNMKRWLGRAKSNDADRYVPEIAYSQTKDYVYRVMANYRMYQFFYDENLRRK